MPKKDKATRHKEEIYLPLHVVLDSLDLYHRMPAAR